MAPMLIYMQPGPGRLSWWCTSSFNFVPHVNREISQQDLPYTIDLINPVVVFLIICRQSISSKKQKKRKKEPNNSMTTFFLLTKKNPAFIESK
jgi:hypothetical protein